MERSALSKLFEFASMPHGWNYGQGVPASASQLDRGAHFLSYLKGIGLSETDVFPGTDGEILIRAYHGGHCLGFLFELDNTISLSHEINDESEDCPENVSLAEAQRFASSVFAEILVTSCSTITSASLIPNTLTGGRVGSSRLRFGRAALMAVHQSSAVSASGAPGPRYVTTLPNITRQWAAIPQSSAA